MDIKTKLVNLAKAVVFILLGCLIFLGVNRMFGVSNEYSDHSKMMINGYYELDENTADVVAIGNSHVYRYCQGAFAWKEDGLAMTAFSTSDMPYSAVKNVVDETLKTQSPKVLLIDATAFNNTTDDPSNKIYLLTNDMKYSKNYVNMVNSFCEYAGLDAKESLEYYFPIVQFHSRWYELSPNDFEQTNKSYLNSCYQKEFLKKTIKGKVHSETDKVSGISAGSEKALKELITYLQDKDVEVLFYAAPVLRGSNYCSRLNYIQKIVEDAGCDFIDFNEDDYYEMFDFDESTDFQDTNHVNVKGSYKFTKVLSDILMEKYGLEDKRGNEAYSNWDKQANAYYKKIDKYLNSEE